MIPKFIPRETFRAAASVALCGRLCARLGFAWLCLPLTGCATGSFYASNVPPQFQAPPVRVRSHADLARFTPARTAPDVIAPGDVLEVTIVSGLEPTRPAPYAIRVNQAGSLDLPDVGPVKVDGLELTQAERLIRDESIRRGIYKNPHVAAVVRERAQIRVTVVGEVVRPGAYDLPVSQAGLVHAIAAAGGVTERADEKITLRNPAFRSDVSLADAKEPQVLPAGDVALASANEPVTAEKASEPPDAAQADKASRPDGAATAAAETKPAADAPKVVTTGDAKPAETKTAEAKTAAKDEAKATEGAIKLASAETQVPEKTADPATVKTADYVPGTDGEIEIDLASAEASVAGLPLEDGAVIVVRERPTRTVQVLGLVKRPDRFEFPDDQELRLLDAIALAGGRTTELADSVKVIRRMPGQEKPVVILASVRYAKRGDADDLPLAPGDVVSIEETPLTFAVESVRSIFRLGFATF